MQQTYNSYDDDDGDDEAEFGIVFLLEDFPFSGGSTVASEVEITETFPLDIIIFASLCFQQK